MSKDVTALLKRAYQDEIEAVVNYITNSIVFDGVRAEEIKEFLQINIQEELTHAEQLGNRPKQLDKQPPGLVSFETRQHDLQPPKDSMDVLAAIDGVLTAEEDVIETCRVLIDVVGEANDPVTEDLAATILADEEAHRAEFRGFKKEYDRE